MSLIERLKQGSELKSTLSIGKLFQRFMIRLLCICRRSVYTTFKNSY